MYQFIVHEPDACLLRETLQLQTARVKPVKFHCTCSPMPFFPSSFQVQSIDNERHIRSALIVVCVS
jgi:hypothetical protein